MLIGFVYVFAFFIGVYIVWNMGRKEFLDEERLVDLSLFSSAVGLIVARGAYFLLPGGGKEFKEIWMNNAVIDAVLILIRLTDAMWWAGVVSFFITVVLLIRLWRWPYWPILGIVSLGGVTSVSISQAALWIMTGLNYHLLLLINGLLAVIILYYVLVMGGDRAVARLSDRVQNIFTSKKPE